MELRIKEVIRNTVFVLFSAFLYLTFMSKCAWIRLILLLLIPSYTSLSELLEKKTCKLELVGMGIAVFDTP
jgi:hypothetical protein